MDLQDWILKSSQIFSNNASDFLISSSLNLLCFCLLRFFPLSDFRGCRILIGVIYKTVISALSHHARGNDFVADWKRTGALSDSFSIVQPNSVFVLFFVFLAEIYMHLSSNQLWFGLLSHFQRDQVNICWKAVRGKTA